MKTEISKIIVGERYRQLQDKNVDFLAMSISMFGLINPIVIDKDYNLVAGLHRLEACKKLGMTTIDTIVTDVTDKEDIKQLEINENVARTSKQSFAEKFKILIETSELIEKMGLKQKAGKPKEGVKLYTLEDIGYQVGLGKEAVKKYIPVWKALSNEAKTFIEANDIKNFNDIKEISDLPQSEQLDAFFGLKEKKKAQAQAKKKEKENVKQEEEFNSQVLKNLVDENKKLKTEVDELKKNLKKSAKSLTEEDYINIKTLYKFAMKACHPDVGGKQEDAKTINNIMDKYKKNQVH
jgi:ParB family chromosome partitioning protein